MSVNLKLPRLSMNMDEATIASWQKQPGDAFKAGETLYSVETEKVLSDVEAPCDGVLSEIFVPEGASVRVGDHVCRIDPK